jgi:hypothetical protein
MARKAIPLVAATLVLTVATQAALAQGAGTSTRRPHQTANVSLKAPPPNFPLPLPPGYTFIMGYESQYEKQRPSTVLRLHSSTAQGGLRDWYAATLTGMGWKVAPATPQGQSRVLMINARKPDQTCLIQLTAAGTGQGGTDLMITFSHK